MPPVASSVGSDLSLGTVLFSGQFRDAIKTGIVVQGLDGATVDCNEGALKLLNLTRDELLGHSPFTGLSNPVRENGSHLPSSEHPFTLTLKSGTTTLDTVIGVDVPGKARQWLLVNSSVYTVDGKTVGVVTSIVDFSDRWKERHALQLLSEVNRIVMSATDDLNGLQQLCDALIAEGNYSLAWIGCGSTEEHGSIDVSCAAGQAKYLEEGMYSWLGSKVTGRGPTGKALRTGVTQVANDLKTQPQYGPWIERAQRFGFNSSVAIPIRIADNRAVLCIYDEHSHALDEKTVQGLENIAKEIEFGIEHVRSMHQLERALDGTIDALARMTEARNPQNAGHQYNVGLLSEAIARQMGLDAQLVDLTRKSGQLHDIGKISIGIDVLAHSSDLDADKIEQLKCHTTIGADILAHASLPWPIAEVALQHHERMDGSGYPAGLSGSETLLPARIVAVADVVETLCHPLLDGDTPGLQLALKEIETGAGKIFDAEVVRACLEVFDAGFAFNVKLRTARSILGVNVPPRVEI